MGHGPLKRAEPPVGGSRVGYQVMRQAPRFDEVPGEAEADAVRDAYLRWAAASPRDLRSSLAPADPATRANVVLRLQEQKGNRFVHRALTEIRSRAFPGRMIGLKQSDMVAEVQRRKGAGSPLSGTVRTDMETFFGADLSRVRVHTDETAVQLNQELEAQAFTVGADVFFSRDKFNPQSSDGRGLLVHELTHVVQQTGPDATAGAAQRSAVQREEADEPIAAPAPDLGPIDNDRETEE